MTCLSYLEFIDPGILKRQDRNEGLFCLSAFPLERLSLANLRISYGKSKAYKQIDGQIAYWGSDVILAHRIVDYAKGGYILCSSKVYEKMKNTKFGKFLDLECPTIFKHNLKTSLYLFYNSQDKEIFDNLSIRLS